MCGPLLPNPLREREEKRSNDNAGNGKSNKQQQQRVIDKGILELSLTFSLSLVVVCV